MAERDPRDDRMDEQGRWRTDAVWGRDRSYSSGREYGDGEYGIPPGRYDRPAWNDRAREWSSTEGWRRPGPFAGRGPRGYQRSDERIREEVSDRLTAHGFIDATDVEVQVVNGEVTLTGFVDSRAAKRAAEDVAEDVYGVRDVHNHLRIQPADATTRDGGVGRTSVLGLTAASRPRTISRRAPSTLSTGTSERRSSGRSRAR